MSPSHHAARWWGDLKLATALLAFSVVAIPALLALVASMLIVPIELTNTTTVEIPVLNTAATVTEPPVEKTHPTIEVIPQDRENLADRKHKIAAGQPL